MSCCTYVTYLRELITFVVANFASRFLKRTVVGARGNRSFPASSAQLSVPYLLSIHMCSSTPVLPLENGRKKKTVPVGPVGTPVPAP